MRKQLLLLWLLLPVAAGAYHYGPGQDRMVLDRAAAAIADGREHAEKARGIAREQGDEVARFAWEQAAESFQDALEIIPDEKVHEARSVRVELAKARMLISKLPEASSDLEALLDEMVADPDADPETLSEARETLASSKYFMTWLLRLEGAGRERWEPEIEAARQNYKLLAQTASEAGDAVALKRHQEDLETAIRLERMDLSELQGLPIPSQ